MNEQNDETQNYALMVVAGVVALVIAGVLAIAVATSLGNGSMTGETDVPPSSATPTARALVDADRAKVYFAFDSDALPPEASEVIARMAETARAESGRVVSISGFHDASGDVAVNVELAKRRALAVQHALEADGVSPDRLLLERPAAANAGTDPREARRVELQLR